MSRIAEVDVPVKRKGGKGGLFGKIFGGLAGGIAGALTGGAALPAIGVGMGLGSTAGGIAGGLADPVKEKAVRQVSPIETAGANDPEVQMAQLGDSLTAAQQLPQDQQQEVIPTLERTRSELQRRIQALKGRIA